MMFLTMNKYLSLSLLWGTSVLLLSMETQSAPITETNSSNSTAEPNKATTTQPDISDLLHNETETQHSTQDPFYKPVDISAVSTDTTVSPTMKTQEATVSGQRDNSNVSATVLVVMNTAAATASSLPPMLTSASEAQTSHNTMMSETAKPTEDQQSPTTSAEMTAPATTSAVMSASSAAPSATAALSSPQPTSTAEPEVTATLSSTTSSDYLTQAPHFIHTLSTPSASARTTKTTNHTTEAAPLFDSTSLPGRTTETATTSTELPSTSQPISGTQTRTSASKILDTTGSSSTTVSVSTDSVVSTTAFSTSPAGGLIHRVPKRLPNITTKSTTTTTAAPCEVSQSSATTEGQTCSIRGVVKHCLITIVALAGLATIFMVSTIVLCTKLSAKKHKVKKAQQGTEMMCISALLPERNYTYTRQRNPVHNGVLVIPTCADSDEDGGDNLTLSSFLPENDRIV